VAELSTSLLFACPLAAVTALLGIPVSSALRDSMPDPWQLAFLFGMILLGTWGVLLTTKFWEAKPLEPIVMRVVLTIAGVLVGLCIQWMSHWTHLERIPGDTFGLRASGVIDVDLPGRAAQFAPLVFVPVFFGIAFGAMRWWKLTSRNRKSRFRLSPLVLTWLLAAILTGLLPSYFPWSGISLVGIAVVTQLVSPWDRQASLAARRKAA
jgi:hypothetical protein